MSSNTRSTSDAEQQTAITIDQTNYDQPTILIHNVATIPNIEDDLKLIIYSRANVVKWLAIIDIVFLIISLIVYALNGAFFWIFLPLFLFCFCGYKGATTYQKNLILIYDFYLLGMTIFYFYIALYSNSFFWFLFVFLEFYFFYYTTRLVKYLNSVHENMIESLRSGWNPSEITYFYY
tara:strand:- start:26 stop:559 length:534 start_codon:yes stop_codon:yes gene_type:complete